MSKTKQTALHKSVISSMRELNNVGKSRHSAKLEAKKNATTSCMKDVKINGIYGGNTYKTYMTAGLKFADWVQENHPNEDIRRLSYAYKNGLCKDYIQYRIDTGKSASTVQKECAALAKLCGVTSDDIYADRPKRHIADIQNSRDYTENSYKKDCDRYGDIVTFTRITGARRTEIPNIREKDISYKSDGSAVCHLDGREHNTKGGRSRDIYILPQNVPELKEIINKHSEDEKKPLFDTVPSHFNSHAVRAMYAGDYYNNIRRPYDSINDKREDIKPYHNRNKLYTSAPSILTTKNGNQYDRQALKTVSEALGHNRTQVISDHYLRFCKPY